MSVPENLSQPLCDAARLSLIASAARVAVAFGVWGVSAAAPNDPAPVGSDLPATIATEMPREVKALEAQFQLLQSERVTAPFNAEIAKLNSGYAGGIEKAIAAQQAAGNLDAVLALKAEKDLLAGNQPVPARDDDQVSPLVKELRSIYRAEYAKHLAAQAANLKAIAEPMENRLAQLEVELTKEGRVQDAVMVRKYREAFSGSTGEAAAASVPAVAQTGASLPPRDGYTNSLGMKFVEVKGTDVLFCIHETRYRDYAAYAAEIPGVDTSWKDQRRDGFAITARNDDHPVTSVSWDDARQFCEWLSKKEGWTYRLPTDEEWSVAVGIGREEKRSGTSSPEKLNGGIQDEFPWGKKWPPPKGSGNYSDQTRKARITNVKFPAIDGYDDGFPTTAPVMSFTPNELGIYDLGGNVQEWCDDWYDRGKTERVMRGGSYGLAVRGQLLSSFRGHYAPGVRVPGFRVVLDSSSRVR
jgi:formylglycine-generating enzyme required for sulfatase activity